MHAAVRSALSTFYVNNRRDGARLLSIALIVAVAALMRADHPLGLGLGAAASALSLYWWWLYRRLPDRGKDAA